MSGAGTWGGLTRRFCVYGPFGQVFIGGKSMGGRMASVLAAEPGLAGILSGCVCFGYPFHPAETQDQMIEIAAQAAAEFMAEVC